MSDTLLHISQSQSQLLQSAISKIVKAIDPVRIICYGVRTNKKEVWSCILKETELTLSTDCDLLIITKGMQGEEHEIVDKVNSKCEKEAIRITAVVHSISAVKEALENGSTFFMEVYTKGEIVYDNGITLLEPLSLKELNITELLEKREKCWNKWFGLAKRFYDTAYDCAFSKRNDVAVFMLHQAVELTCIAVIRTCMGYRPSTHNLKRLFSLIENFTLNTHGIFPRSTHEEAELFNVLCKAYSEVRYKEEYSITAGMVFILIDRVKAFQSIAENLYNNKIREITKNE